MGLLVAAVSLLFHLTYFRHGVQNLVDLGVVCGDAERILDGEVPGRDFMESYGPARFYITALAFFVAGKSLLTFSAVCVLFLSIKDAMVFLAARFLLSRRWALYVAALSIMVHGPIHKVFLAFSALLVILAAFRFAKKPGIGEAALLGAAAAVAGLFRYDVGAAGIVIGLLLLCVARGHDTRIVTLLKKPGAFFLGITAVAFPVCAMYALSGVSAPAFVDHHLKRVYCLEQANAGSPSAFDLPFSGEPFEYLFGYLLVFYAAVVLSCAASALLLWRSKSRDRPRAITLLVLVLMCVLLYNQVRLGVKFTRMSQISPPFFMLTGFLLQGLHGRLSSLDSTRFIRGLKAACPAAAIVFFAFLGGYIWSYEGCYSQDSFAVLRLPKHYVDKPTARCFFKRMKGLEIEEVIDYIQTHVPENEPIFTGPSCPLFHFLADRRNPTPFTDFTFYYFNKKNQELVIESLEKEGVNIIVHWRRELTGFYFENCAQTLTSYLKTNFVPLKSQIGRFVILERSK